MTRCKNGLAINYIESYMRRRDPDCLVVAETKIQVKGLDLYGRQKTVGWTFPAEVVEYLTEWLTGNVDQSKYKKV